MYYKHFKIVFFSFKSTAKKCEVHKLTVVETEAAKQRWQSSNIFNKKAITETF